MLLKIKRYGPRDWKVHPPYLYEHYRSTPLRSPRKPLIPLTQTLSELTGPVYGHDTIQPGDGDLTTNAGRGGEAIGERIIVTGRVLEEDGRPVPNTLIEVWQANAAGRYPHKRDQHDAPHDPNFMGADRCMTDEKGEYRFETIKPGSVPVPDHSTQAPHINVIVFARGMLSHAFTRIYFEDEAANQNDSVLMSIDDEAHRNTLIARREEADGAVIYRFDIHFQGGNETAFFDA